MVLYTPGLPQTGSVWSPTGTNDGDVFAYCTPKTNVALHSADKDAGGNYWKVTKHFTTKPQNRCQDHKVEDPLDEPDKISGSFVKHQRRLTKDKDGAAILTSSLEEIEGLTRPGSNPTVSITQNVADLQLATLVLMIDGVNDAELWEIPARGVMLSSISWSREFYGGCNIYYTRTLDFEVAHDGTNYTHDIDDIVDYGYKVWDGVGAKTDSDSFKVVLDPETQQPLPNKSPLNGAGEKGNPAVPSLFPSVAWAYENNFFELGIPAVLDS